PHPRPLSPEYRGEGREDLTMSLAIAGLGTAVPATRVTQAEALVIAQRLCCPTEEQLTWLPGIYLHSGIDTRHLAFDPEVVRDFHDGTRHSGSPFLPKHPPGDPGPRAG